MLTIHDDVRKFVLENFLFGEDGHRLHDDSSFLEEGLIDSTGVLELVAHLEQTFAITIEDDELVPENLDSIRHVVSFVERKRSVVAG